MAFNGAEPTARSKEGPDVASLNAHLPPQPRRTTLGAGAEGRDAGTKAGIESGCYMKEGMDDKPGAGEMGLGKPIEPMGTPPWTDPPREMVGGRVTDTFGAGQEHEIKNG